MKRISLSGCTLKQLLKILERPYSNRFAGIYTVYGLSFGLILVFQESGIDLISGYA